MESIAFAWRTFGVALSPSWFSKFMKEHHLSVKIPSKANKFEFDDLKAIADGAAFIRRIRRRCRNGGQVCALDKTKFRCDTRLAKHISPKGGYTTASCLLGSNLLADDLAASVPREVIQSLLTLPLWPMVA